MQVSYTLLPKDLFGWYVRIWGGEGGAPRVEIGVFKATDGEGQFFGGGRASEIADVIVGYGS